MNADNINDEKVLYYDFTKNFYVKEQIGEGTTFTGWKSQVIDNGADLPAKDGEGFDFIYDNIPTAANFVNPTEKGTMEAKNYTTTVNDVTTVAYETDWVNNTCPSPEYNLMLLGNGTDDNGLPWNTEGAKFSMAILVDETDSYTVEFWFKAYTENGMPEKLALENKNDAGQNVTFLYIMKGQKLNVDYAYIA